MSAAFGLICTALPGILLSPFAGALGDLLPEKPLLAAMDFTKAALVLLYLDCRDIRFVYILLVIFSILDTLCSPARRKFTAGVAGKNHLLEANSLLTGAAGAAFLIGPLIGGVLADSFGTGLPFFINSLTYLVSGTATLAIQYGIKPARNRRSLLAGIRDMGGMIYEGYLYLGRKKQLKNVFLVSAVLCFGAVSMNMAFYPFAFDVLRLTAKGWSLMLSIFNGTNLAALAVLPVITKTGKRSPNSLILGCMALTGVIWFAYALTINLPAVLLLQFLEGTVTAVCGILLGTMLQTISDRDYLARVSGFNDLINSIVRLASIAFAYLSLKYMDYRLVFYSCSVVMLVFALGFSATFAPGHRNSKISH